MSVNVINVDGGGDYASLSAWEADLSGTLSEIEEADCQVTGGTPSADTTPCVLAGFTPTSSYYPLINATGTHTHSGQWTNAKFRMIVDDDYSIDCQVQYARIIGLQFRRTYTSIGWSTGLKVTIWSTPSDIRIGRCICESTGDNNRTLGVFGGSGCTVHVYNCILGPATTDCIYAENSTNLYIYNSTIVKADRYCVSDSTSGTFNVKNCTVADGSSDEFNGSPTIDYCASDDGDGTNAQTLSGTRANDFTDWNNGDYSIVSGSVQENNGVTDPDSWGGYSDDIIGTSRPQGASWDIGAWERIVAAGVAPTGVLYGPLVGPLGGPI